MANRQEELKRRYLRLIFKDKKEKERFREIFSKSKSYEQCKMELEKFYNRHKQSVPETIGIKSFIEACYMRARREGLVSKNVSGTRQAWILTESEEDQKFFKEEYLKHRGKGGLQNLLSLLRARGMNVRTKSSILNAAQSLGLPGRTELPSVEPEVELPTAHDEANLREDSIVAKRYEALFGDLKSVPRINIPKTDGDNPFRISVNDPNRPEVMLINSPLVGTLPPEKDSMDMFRNSIRYAAATKHDAIIITGNLIYCLVEKYGKERPYRTQVIGLTPDAELLESAYPPAVLKEIGPLAKRIDNNKVVFMTIKVFLDQIFKILRQKFLTEDGKPIYKGNVYVILGELEEAIAMYYSNEALRVEVFQEKYFAHKKIRELRQDLTSARKDGNTEEITRLMQEINDWQVYDRVLALMGNVSANVIDERRKQMINYLAHRIESDIPNAKVIGVGDTYIQGGKQRISITNDKVTDSIRGGLAGRLRKKVYNYVKAHRGERIPLQVLGGGLNPYGNGLYVSFRIREKEKKSALDDVRMSGVTQLLPCIDAHLYRETVRRMLKTKDRIARLAGIMNFESGVAVLRFFEPAPFERFDWYKADFLQNQEIFGSDTLLKKYVSGQDKRSANVYSYKEGCLHYGASYVARYPSPKDPDRPIKHHTQVLFEAFLRDEVPIHMYQNDGDIQHWMNYQTYKEGNPQWLDPEEMLEAFNKIETDSRLSPEEKLRLFKTKSLDNSLVAGVMQPEDQIDFFARTFLGPYIQVFEKIIDRAHRAGIEIEGHLGIISIGQGNHNEHTFNKSHDVRFSEAKLTRKEILAQLWKSGYHRESLEKDIRACQIGGIGLANGIFRVKSLGDKAYEYCVFMKHKHGSSKTEDNMRRMIDNFSTRGTTDDYEEGKFTINLGGDDHMGGHAVTRNAFHVKTGGQMFSGPFGLMLDFPKQNLFSAIWSVPAGGPSWGPCSVIRFDFRMVRKLAAYKVVLPKELFENPI